MNSEKGTLVVALIAAAAVISACSNAAVSKAIGTMSDGGSVIVVRASESAVIIENHAGRPLLNVRVAISTAGAAAPFIVVVPTIDAGSTVDLSLTSFRNEEAATLDPASVMPRQVQVTARDTLANSYDVTVPWAP